MSEETAPPETDRPDPALRAKLDRVAAHEASVEAGLLTRVMRRLGRTKAFSIAYSKVGPIIDPKIRDLRDGKVMAAVYGLPILTLHTTGAKSGQPRVSPLVYVRDGDDVMLIGTNFGQAKHPGWTANLLAHPDASVQIGAETVQVRATLVDDETWARLFPSFVAVYPGYADYMTRRGHLPPRMFRLVPVG
ncbi:MAG: nitroreductase/quinone reductase family protein [Candidatus Nanopelagicales bacterium]|jgi:deazaflavin-dependent oxidoreductase (nitroreductase family)